MLELDGLCELYGANEFAWSANVDALFCKLASIKVDIP